MGEVILWIILLIISIVLFIQTLGYKTVEMVDPIVGPARFPQVIILIMAICLVALLVKRIFIKKKEDKPFIFLELFKGIQLRFGLMMLIYILILGKVGFIVSTSLFLIASTTYLYYEKHKTIPVKATVIRSICIILFTSGLYYVFTQFMGVILPRGDIFSSL